MYKAQIENSGGESITLTQNEEKWQVVSITGLNPPDAQINITDIAGLDGGKFNSSKLNTRNLVIMLKLNGIVEENRQELYRFFRTKDNCVFYFKNKNRDVSIKGVIETVECDLFSNAELMQISIICPYPYFRAMAEVISIVSNEIAAFKFPFSINVNEPIPISTYVESRITDVVNRSEAETGVLITIDVLEAISTIQIQNTVTGEYISLAYAFQAGDRILIDTNKGQKSIRLIRAGETSNIFSAMRSGSTFFQLAIGSNYFGYLADDGDSDENVYITFTYYHLYRGV